MIARSIPAVLQTCVCASLAVINQSQSERVSVCGKYGQTDCVCNYHREGQANRIIPSELRTPSWLTTNQSAYITHERKLISSFGLHYLHATTADRRHIFLCIGKALATFKPHIKKTFSLATVSVHVQYYLSCPWLIHSTF